MNDKIYFKLKKKKQVYIINKCYQENEAIYTSEIIRLESFYNIILILQISQN